MDGAYAEHTILPASSAMNRPENLTPEQAAASPLVFTTAWHALHTRARLQPGETLLVLAGASGVGTAAIQIGKLLGARVIATAGSPEKLERCRALGADEAINHRNSDYSPRVLELTGDQGANVVLDHIGAETWGRSLASLARGGRMVAFGVTTGASATVQIRPLYQKHHSILGSYLGSRREMAEVMAHIAAGRLKPIVDSVFPLEQAPEAHRRMEQSHHFGKILIKT